ncbi:hypothetical protein WJX74_003473 [Apatococcus lobatus]|uniref:Uncharacterized protein n=1 Tax=Apatococcus lobatus TaxID=904363 RepID=A0AAW1RND8_9CHLO
MSAADPLTRSQTSGLAASKLRCKVVALEHDLEASKKQLAEARHRVQLCQEAGKKHEQDQAIAVKEAKQQLQESAETQKWLQKQIDELQGRQADLLKEAETSKHERALVLESRSEIMTQLRGCSTASQMPLKVQAVSTQPQQECRDKGVENAQLQQVCEGKDADIARLQHLHEASEQLVDSIEQELCSIKQHLQEARSQVAAQADKLQQHQAFTQKALARHERLLDLLKKKTGVASSLEAQLKASQAKITMLDQQMDEKAQDIAASHEKATEKDTQLQRLQDSIAHGQSERSHLLKQLQARLD